MPDVGDVAGEHRHPPLLQLLGAGHDPQERRLADAVGADDADHEAGRDVERDAVQGLDVAVEVGHVPDADHRLVERCGGGFLFCEGLHG